MKIQSFLIVLMISLIWTGCQDKVTESYTAGVPVYMSYDDLRAAVKITDPVLLEKPGKIYFKDNYIYINEYFKGIHVIDNSNPSSPQEKKFIEIPGNVDIAIKDNVLYADSYVDLVGLDISDLSNIKEKSRIENVFPYTTPQNPSKYTEEWPDQTKGVVIRWEVKNITKDVKPQHPYPYPVYYDYYMYSAELSNFAGAKTGSSGSSQGGVTSVGVAGSMARFAILNNALYVLTSYQIKVVDITNINLPVSKATINSSTGNIETIFLNGGYMYIGSQTGMGIYSTADPFNPTSVSTYNHFTSCDPVVVEGNYAFVTLRSGVWCRNNITNQLDVIDISNKTKPTLLKSYGFTEPHGLGIDNSILFICDGKDGLKVYNATDVMQITQNLISHFKDIQATDVIPVNGLLFMIGNDGFYQYDYTNLQNIKLLSHIAIKK